MLGHILQQPEGRRLELKVKMPAKAELVKSVISFANDAGGELYIGIQDSPRKIVGIDKNKLTKIEEQISSIIHDQCAPTILPEITFLINEGKHIILTKIHKGSAPPYHLKSKEILKGTYIRVGSTNRLASEDIINELKRQGQNISFDSEVVFQKPASKINLKLFSELFFEKTKEKLTPQIIDKLELYKKEQGELFATNALVLLSDDVIRRQLFPYAKIECARFKGSIPGNFIDQKNISVNIGLQAELAYQFVLRHISEGSIDYTGVYRIDRWEYPIIAIREVIRNAVIHRDYALTGKDIKIAIFDDKIEITSPGKLMPSIDFSDMDSGQSDIRNKVLAPVFKRIGIIEQWGNGLKLIRKELQSYPEIDFSWNEPGIAFRLTFAKKNYEKEKELQHELQRELQHELLYALQQELQQESQQVSLYSKVLRLVKEKDSSTQELSTTLKQRTISGQLKKILVRLRNDNLVEWTIPDIQKSSKQKYRITKRGLAFLHLIDNKT